MQKILFAIIPAALLANSAYAVPATIKTDGLVFEYVAQSTAGDDVTISGRSRQDGSTFTLTVHGTNVRGTMNGSPVSFDISRSTRRQLDREVGTTTAMAS